MARLPPFFSNLCRLQNPNSFRIRNRNLSSDQFNGITENLAHHHKNPDEISAQDRIFSINGDKRSSEDLMENPNSFRIRNRNLSSDQFNGITEKLAHHHKNPDEVSAQDRIFSLNGDNRSSEDLMENPRNPDERFAHNQVISVCEIAKEVSGLIRTRPRWEQTLLIHFPAVDFTDPTVYNEVLNQLTSVFLSLRFYLWLRSLSDSSFDPVLCNAIFSRLVEAKAAHAAMNFLNDAKFEPEPCDLESYIVCLCENGLIDQALNVFERLRLIGYHVSLQTWNQALSHSVRTKRVDAVWKLYGRMTEYGITTDVNTIGHLIKAFCLENNVSKGYDLLQQVLEAGHVPDNTVFIKLVAAFGKKRKYREVSGVLYNMIANNCSPDIYTYQEVIKGLCKGGMTSKGLRVFSELKDRGYFPDRVVYTTMIHGLCRDNDLGGARNLWFEMIRNGIVPNEYTYNAYIDGLLRNGCIDEAEKLHKVMVDKGYGETIISFNTRINGLYLNGKAEEARALFEEMKEKGIAGDSITYNTLIKGFSQKGKTTEAMYFFNELIKKGFRPSPASFTIFIKVLCQGGQVKEAEQLWVDMRSRGLEPTLQSLDPIILGLSKEGSFAKAMEWLGYMISSGVRPKAMTFEKLVECLSASCKFDDALSVLGSMHKMGLMLGKNMCHYLVCRLCGDDFDCVRTSLGKVLE